MINIPKPIMDFDASEYPNQVLINLKFGTLDAFSNWAKETLVDDYKIQQISPIYDNKTATVSSVDGYTYMIYCKSHADCMLCRLKYDI
jgi:hypothetical protein